MPALPIKETGPARPQVVRRLPSAFPNSGGLVVPEQGGRKDHEHTAGFPERFRVTLCVAGAHQPLEGICVRKSLGWGEGGLSRNTDGAKAVFPTLGLALGLRVSPLPRGGPGSAAKVRRMPRTLPRAFACVGRCADGHQHSTQGQVHVQQLYSEVRGQVH